MKTLFVRFLILSVFFFVFLTVNSRHTIVQSQTDPSDGEEEVVYEEQQDLDDIDEELTIVGTDEGDEINEEAFIEEDGLQGQEGGEEFAETNDPTPPPAVPTVNPLCACKTDFTCKNNCGFVKFTDINTYANPIKCSVAATFFTSAPTGAQKTNWCKRPMKTKGDATGDGKVTLVDYYYYLQAKVGGKVPPSINPDFNGDNLIDKKDRTIVIKSLKK